MTSDPVTTHFLRHTLATLAYRAQKVLRELPPGFAGFRVGPAARTPAQLAGHLADLLEWACSIAAGKERWEPASSGQLEAEIARFFAALARLDTSLAAAALPEATARTLFQGPIADALTHVGQLALLRGLCGAQVRPESYARSEIVVGRVGAEQAPARREFDGDASARPRKPPPDAGQGTG